MGKLEYPMACQWPPGGASEVCGKRQPFGDGAGPVLLPRGLPWPLADSKIPDLHGRAFVPVHRAENPDTEVT